MRYRAEETDRTSERIRYRVTIPSTSPLVDGHFPGNPILPGVAQVLIVTELVGGESRWTGLESVRFRKPILPDAPFVLEISTADADGRIAFRFTDGDRPVTEGVLTRGRKPADV